MPCISLYPDANKICTIQAGITVDFEIKQSLFSNFKVGKGQILVHKNLMTDALHNANAKEGDSVVIFNADYAEIGKKQGALFASKNFEETEDLIIHFTGIIPGKFKVSIINSDYAVLQGGVKSAKNSESSTFEALLLLKPGKAFYFSIFNLENNKRQRCKALWNNNHLSVCLILNGKEQKHALSQNIYVFNDLAQHELLTKDIIVNCA